MFILGGKLNHLGLNPLTLPGKKTCFSAPKRSSALPRFCRQARHDVIWTVEKDYSYGQFIYYNYLTWMLRPFWVVDFPYNHYLFIRVTSGWGLVAIKIVLISDVLQLGWWSHVVFSIGSILLLGGDKLPGCILGWLNQPIRKKKKKRSKRIMKHTNLLGVKMLQKSEWTHHHQAE